MGALFCPRPLRLASSFGEGLPRVAATILWRNIDFLSVRLAGVSSAESPSDGIALRTRRQFGGFLAFARNAKNTSKEMTNARFQSKLFQVALRNARPERANNRDCSC